MQQYESMPHCVLPLVYCNIAVYCCIAICLEKEHTYVAIRMQIL